MLDTTALLTFSNGGAVRVPKIYGQSTNGFFLQQTNSSAQGIIVDSNGNLVTEGGEIAIDLSGSEGAYSLSNDLGSGDWSVAFVGQHIATGTGYVFDVRESSAPSNFIVALYSSGAYWDGSWVGTPPDMSTQKAYAVQIEVGNAATVYENGGATQTNLPPTNRPINAGPIFFNSSVGASGFDGIFQEVVIWNSIEDLTAIQADQVDHYSI